MLSEQAQQKLRSDAIRFLSLDAVEKAKSGHPGAPMGLADAAEVLWHQFLKHNPGNPRWPNRDRFVLSNGHASMLLYSLLHLTGYPLTLDDIKAFRQWGSHTPGHPEYDLQHGVETTTGPLGQGFANAVGMALAEKILAARYNRPGLPIISHLTYVFLGDGCLMEGISHEVASLAGTWGLEKLIVLWDDNGISIDGPVKDWCADDVALRFKAYGFTVIHVDGHDPEALREAFLKAQNTHDGQPKFICCKTHIAFGAPQKQGSADAHGTPLGAAEALATREALGWSYAPFEIPDMVYQTFNAREKGARVEQGWQALWQQYEKTYPAEAQELTRLWENEQPAELAGTFERLIQQFESEKPELASRQASQAVLNQLGPLLPELMGGSADLTPSNGTFWKGATVFSSDKNPSGQYLHYGVREFGMTAIMNGLALHGEFRPYGGTFLTFSDYARNGIRMSALMSLPVVAVYTHDSIGLGEDGPTHQPIEHLNMLRMTPNLDLWRPMDATETAVAWREALKSKTRPSALALSRQKLKWVAARSRSQCDNIAQGAYVLWEPEGPLEGILIATGSEVELAFDAAQQLARQGLHWRVVSMPSADVFLRTDLTYQESVLPHQITHRVAVEAGATDYWYRFVGLKGRVVGLDHFGGSAPAAVLYREFGVTVERIVSIILDMLKQ